VGTLFAWVAVEEGVVEPLVIALAVIVVDEFRDGPSKNGAPQAESSDRDTPL
jgi:hypothetical protein